MQLSQIITLCEFLSARGNTVNTQSEAYFGAGTKLTVLEAGLPITPPTVKVLPPSTNECRSEKDKKRKKTLVCVASGFYPDHVSVFWQINGANTTDGVATDSAALRDGATRLYQITSRLRVDARTWFSPDNNFKCTVTFFDGKELITRSGSIPGIQDNSGGGMSREKYLKITQTAKLSYAVFIIKSCIYGGFVCFLLWKLQSSGGKQTK